MEVIGMDRRCALPTLHGIDPRLALVAQFD